MRRGGWLLALSALSVLAAVPVTDAHAKAKAGKYFEDKKWGYKLRVPKGWNRAAMSADESWICSKHIGDRDLTPKEQEYVWSWKPDMWVIGFPHLRQKDRGAKRTEKDGISEIRVNNPYKDYKDFLKRESWFVGGGYFFSKEEEGTVGDQKVTMYEVKVTKMVRAPTRIVAWVFHYEDVDYAVQFKVLEDYYDSHKGAFESCLKSFKRIASESGIPTGVTTGPTITDEVTEKDLTPEEREKRRREQVKRKLKKEIDNLPKDWHHKESDHYVVLSHGNKKFTKKVLAYAEGIRKYLDETFPGIGSDYVPQGIIRIFNSYEEQTAFWQGTRSIWASGVRQVMMVKQHGAEGKWEFEGLAMDVTRQWLDFKNRELANNMPYWLSTGLSQHMKFARVKGSKIEFKPDEWDRESIKKLIKGEKTIGLEDLVSGDTSKFTQWDHRLQAGSVFGWLMTKGNRGKLKNSVRTYLGNLLQSIETALEEEQKTLEKLQKKALDARKKQSGKEESADEEEEDKPDDFDAEKQWEEIRKAILKRMKTIRQEAFDSTFGHMTEKDWQKADRSWQKWAK